MDTIATIIVTAFINLALSNFLFYRYQKRIDDKYNTQLEEFKAGLERSNFEYQTKFSRKIPKSLEVLEVVYQKFSDSKVALTEFLEIFDDSRWRENVSKDDVRTYRKNFVLKVQETLMYFENNRIFISDVSITEVSSILKRAKNIASFVNRESIFDHFSERTVNNINHWIRVLEVGIREIVYVDEDFGFSPYLLGLDDVYAKLSQQLEQHYKAVLDG